MNYDFNIPPDKLKEFKKLYKKDRFENLCERYEYFVTIEPELFQRKLGFVPMMIEHVWTVIPIRGENFAFSAGFYYEYQQPEIMVISDELGTKEYQLLINEICCYVRDKKPIELGKDYAKEILIKNELDLATSMKDKDLPEAERRLVTKKGKEFKLLDIDRPLVFQEYTPEVETDFPCGYLRSFYRNFTDTEDFKMIYTDLT